MDPHFFSHRFTKLLWAPVMALSLSAGSARAGVPSLSHLFVFGDSFSDSGNAYAISGGRVMPSPPYNGGRFTNGPVTVEHLWQAFNPGDTTFQASEVGGTNFAVGGSTTGRENFLSWFLWDQGLPNSLLSPYFRHTGNAWQLSQFKSGKPAFDPSTSLFAVWMFPNDIFTEFLPSNNFQGIGTYNGNPSPNGVENIVPTAVANVIGTIQELASEGARHFLVPNTPDLGKLPFFSGSPAKAEATALSLAFNTLLDQELAKLSEKRLDIDITPFKTEEFFNAVMSNPSFYGISNATEACYDEAVSPTPCATPETYLYWDTVHPTTSVQKLLSQRMYEATRDLGGTSVPAPVPVAGGMALVGWSRRLRRRLRPHSQRTIHSCAGRCPAD